MSASYSDHTDVLLGGCIDSADRRLQPRSPEGSAFAPRRRNFFRRVEDEVRSWFGDQEAAWRRRTVDLLATHATRPFGSTLTADELMTQNIVTVQPDDSIEHAAKLMDEFDCGALPVVDHSGLLLGIITDRDITVRIVARGLNIDYTEVSDCMTKEAFACNPGDSIESCMRMMSWFQVRRIPVVDSEHRVIGMVSQSDIVRHAGERSGRAERRAMIDVLCAVSDEKQVAYRSRSMTRSRGVS